MEAIYDLPPRRFRALILLQSVGAGSGLGSREAWLATVGRRECVRRKETYAGDCCGSRFPKEYVGRRGGDCDKKEAIRRIFVPPMRKLLPGLFPFGEYRKIGGGIRGDEM